MPALKTDPIMLTPAERLYLNRLVEQDRNKKPETNAPQESTDRFRQEQTALTETLITGRRHWASHQSPNVTKAKR